jgi:hypothetical protein
LYAFQKPSALSREVLSIQKSKRFFFTKKLRFFLKELKEPLCQKPKVFDERDASLFELPKTKGF